MHFNLSLSIAHSLVQSPSEVILDSFCKELAIITVFFYPNFINMCVQVDAVSSLSLLFSHYSVLSFCLLEEGECFARWE